MLIIVEFCLRECLIIILLTGRSPNVKSAHMLHIEKTPGVLRMVQCVSGLTVQMGAGAECYRESREERILDLRHRGVYSFPWSVFYKFPGDLSKLESGLSNLLPGEAHAIDKITTLWEARICNEQNFPDSLISIDGRTKVLASLWKIIINVNFFYFEELWVEIF